MNQRGTLARQRRSSASAGVEAKLVAEERLEYHAGGKIK